MESTTTTRPVRVGAWSAARVLRTFTQEVEARGGETAIYGEGTRRWELEISDRVGGLVVLHAEGWRAYSRAFGSWRASLSYLAGADDNGLWAARVPGTVTTVEEALAALTPAEVKGRESLRQGDVYLVRMERPSATTDSGVIRGTHLWDAGTRTLTHEPAEGVAHGPVVAPATWPGVKVIGQRRYEGTRGYTRD